MGDDISTGVRLHRRCIAAVAVTLTGILVAACGSGNSDRVATTAPPPPTVNPGITVQRIDYPTRGPRDPAQNWGDLYLPAGLQAVDTIPLVVLIHGGAWKSRLNASTMSSYATDLAKRGMAVWNIEYRRVGSGGGWPTTFTDVADALDHVIAIDEQFPQLTVDDELVVGHSAGAQLAVWGGTRNSLHANEVGSNPKFRPTRVVSLAGPLDMVYAAHHGDRHVVAVLGGTPEAVPDRYRSVNPIEHIDPTVPIIAVHGNRDTVVPLVLSQRYIDEVHRRGGIGGMVVEDGENHGSIVDPKSKAYPRILDIITDASSKTREELARTYG
jgi:acetyl esterase/lipase